jgi:hypothetical protein
VASTETQRKPQLAIAPNQKPIVAGGSVRKQRMLEQRLWYGFGVGDVPEIRDT